MQSACGAQEDSTGASSIEMRISADLEKIWVWGGGRDQDPLCCVFKNNVTLREVLSSLANQGLQAELPVRSSAGHFREPGCRFGFEEELVPVFSCAALRGLLQSAVRGPWATWEATTW